MSSQKTSTATQKKTNVTKAAAAPKKAVGSNAPAKVATPSKKAPAKKAEKSEEISSKESKEQKKEDDDHVDTGEAESMKEAEQLELEDSAESIAEGIVSMSIGDKKTAEVVDVEKYINDLITRKRDEGKRLREEIQMLRDMKVVINKRERDMKKTKKKGSTTKNGVQKKPSGFHAPTRISDEMCDFLGLERGTEIPRTKVTTLMHKYISDNNLKDENDKRFINPDDALDKLTGGPEMRLQTMKARKAELDAIAAAHPEDGSDAKKDKDAKARNCKVTERLANFNMQSHLTRHFFKAEKKKASSSPVEKKEEEPVSEQAATVSA